MKSFQDKVNEQIEKEISLQHKLLKWGVILLVTGYIFRLFIS
ncbi:hypothetical protein QDY71_00925 [Kingella negevensis]|uniref:Uncharacterized protein n=1 Tax=Kingella negevensis TaxID=1522312 RepID=A0A238TBR9_9NEIS|nr:hypothetical protein [Kingella negevensis]MDK4680039.1 hypothetical protein [Kingella negevensis]MDK4682241.1 hypothetical protein [Kingella negevensis]MDK4684812.1 hypothetical protein [Kingella negevensis]MDK4688262.1 hypothetical protein [Kingella negevensis]MDK4690438.1 hypothetical protein [Kingella negevensis]